MITTHGIYWVAALLEGEGCFRTAGGSPTICLEMTDGDIVYRLAALWNKPLHPPRPRRYPGSKPLYKVSLSGAKAAGWMMTIYRLMSQRRKGKIREVLTAFRASPIRPKGAQAVCHPERPHAGHGLCNSCYAKHRRALCD